MRRRTVLTAALVTASGLRAAPADDELPPPDPGTPDPPDSAPPGPAMAGPAPSHVKLVIDGPVREADCTDRNVIVRAAGSSLRLAGGCRSVTVDASDVAVVAELRGGARIAISGDRVSVVWRVIGPGPDPIVSISGADSHATRE